MKVNPGDLIIDNQLNRILTIISVERKANNFQIGDYKIQHDLIKYKDSRDSPGATRIAWEYELDSWAGIQLIQVRE